MKRSTYLNVAMGCFVFALCFAGIPIYRTFCEHMGLVGDSDKKEYTFDGSKSTFYLIKSTTSRNFMWNSVVKVTQNFSGNLNLYKKKSLWEQLKLPLYFTVFSTRKTSQSWDFQLTTYLQKTATYISQKFNVFASINNSLILKKSFCCLFSSIWSLKSMMTLMLIGLRIFKWHILSSNLLNKI